MTTVPRRSLLRATAFLPFISIRQTAAQIVAPYPGDPANPGDPAMTDVTQNSTSSNSSKKQKPSLTYWHVWTDDQGISHQTRCELTNFEQSSIAEGTDLQWNNHLLTSGANIMFTVLPVNWVGEWHENPQPQWIVPLSGRWFVETMDGQRVEMGSGEVSFGGDQNTQPDGDGKKGHLSGTVGYLPTLLVTLEVQNRTSASTPWYGNAVACVTVILGFVLDAPWQSE